MLVTIVSTLLGDASDIAKPPPLPSKPPQRSLADAFDQVLEKNPGQVETILSNHTTQAPPVTEKTLDEQAKKLYKKEVQAKLASLRVKPCPETANREKILKKIGTAGVVQFFNAVYKAQQAKDANTEKQKLVSAERKNNKKKDIIPKVEESSQTSNTNFLDLIKR